MQTFKNVIAQNILFLVVFTVFLFSCKKEPEPLTLPPATQTGENTFGCLVNGEVWVANGAGFYPTFFEKGYVMEESVLGILCYNTKDFECRSSVRLSLRNFDGVGEYDSEDFTQSLYYFGGCIAELDGYYYVDTSLINLVRVDYFNLEERIISGTFEYNLIDKETGEKLKITDGRFDVGELDAY